MATLFNTRISDTYFGLIKTIDNAVISATLRELSDGAGNGTGLSLNNAGDFKVNAILEFGSLKDSGENIIISKFVDAADGIGNNDNDTSIPTSAAVVAYVAGQITAEDLDFRGDDSTVLGDVDLNSQAFIILGTANEIETSVTSAGGNTLKIGIPSNPVLTGIVTATTFSGDLNGTINTATTAVTQSAGDNSTKVATTAYVDVLDAASDLDFSGDSGTGDVTLNTQTFAITGTTNQVITSASNETLNISLPSTVHRNLEGNVVGNLTGDVTGNVAGDLTGNVTASSVLANGVTGTTQASSDNSTKIATTAYVKGLDNASDLDITDGSNTGDVNLNTQSLSILGTSQQVVSTVSNQSVTLSLPSSINVNSASATILQNARDISLTGEASGTISSFNGSANVSGAVTLNNDSVTGKVLTGLASPTATNILASDSILEAFGKTQSQLNTLAGGLRFMGTWNATTNDPTLASGGGESASGTTTGTTAFKLVDSGGGFTSALVGDQVVNQASGATAEVTNFDSSTVLSLSVDIMVSGQEYTIDNSPFLTQGHYYVVSVGGTSSLNGLTNWAVGDWVIAGATNVWEKLDHTQVDGTGTVGNITKWSSTNVIADSIMAESGSTITATGSIAATQLLSSGGNFAVNTDKFTANATTGNVAVAGNVTIPNGLISTISGNNLTISGNVAEHAGLSFATNTIIPVVVSAETNNVVDIGQNGNAFKNLYLGSEIISGGGATFVGKVTISQDSTTDPVLSLSDTGVADYDFTFTDTGTIKLGVNTSSTKTLKLINAGTGSFNLEVNGTITGSGGSFLPLAGGTMTGNINFNNSVRELKWNHTSGESASRAYGFIGEQGAYGRFALRSSNAADNTLDTDVLYFDNDLSATFAGNVNAGAGLQMYTDGSGNGVIFNTGQNKDLYLVVDDNGTGVNALVFDGSENGNATFAGSVGVGGKTPAYGLNLAQGTAASNKIAWTDGTPDFAASIYASSSTDKLTFATKNSSNVETTALEIDTNQGATFAKAVNIAGTLTLDQGSLLNGIINTPASLRINIDSDNNQTGEKFIVGHSQTNIDNNNILLEINESGSAEFTGNLGIGIGANASYKLRIKTDATHTNGAYISAGTGNGNHSFYVEDKDATAEYFAVRGDGQIRMGASGLGDVIIGSTAINGSFGASNTVLAVKGNTSGGEGIVQISGLGGNAGDNVGRISFYSQAQANPLAEIRAVRGNSDTNGRLETYTANTLRDRLDENGAFEFQGAETGVMGVRFQGSGTCNGYSGTPASFYVMDVMRDQGSGKAMNVQGTIDIAAGYGIGFGAASGSGATSTLLDDYEEGTWTPAIYYQNSTDQGNATNTTQTGIYTKVGRKVTVMFRLIWEITGSPATDNCGIQNLPFNGQTISNNSTYAEVPCTLKGYSNPSTGGRGSLTMTLPNNNQSIALFNDSNIIGNMGGVIGAGTHEIRFSFTYTTDQ